MIVWAVLALALCGVLPTLTEVVDDFRYCSGFFYKGSQPQGFDQNAHKICQKLHDSSYFFASLYSTAHRIPLYSAYTFDNTCNNEEGRKTGNWFIEPQVNCYYYQFMGNFVWFKLSLVRLCLLLLTSVYFWDIQKMSCKLLVAWVMDFLSMNKLCS